MNRNTNVENMHFTANDAKPVLCAVHLGTMIVAENTLFKVVKKYNDFVWRLKSENGEVVNVFYALSQIWSLHGDDINLEEKDWHEAKYLAIAFAIWIRKETYYEHLTKEFIYKRNVYENEKELLEIFIHDVL